MNDEMSASLNDEMKQNIDWSKLGFHYTEPEYIVRAGYHNGKWEEPYATRDKYLQLHVSATCLQYGQEAFEGLKAFRGIDEKIRIFRWRDNARRMAKSAEGLFMAPVPEELFGKAIRLALEKNIFTAVWHGCNVVFPTAADRYYAASGCRAGRRF